MSDGQIGMSESSTPQPMFFIFIKEHCASQLQPDQQMIQEIQWWSDRNDIMFCLKQTQQVLRPPGLT